MTHIITKRWKDQEGLPFLQKEKKKKNPAKLHGVAFTWHDNKILVSPRASIGEQI